MEQNKECKKAILAIKISLLAMVVSILLGTISLWVTLNQITLSVEIDKKLTKLENETKVFEK